MRLNRHLGRLMAAGLRPSSRWSRARGEPTRPASCGWWWLSRRGATDFVARLLADKLQDVARPDRPGRERGGQRRSGADASKSGDWPSHSPPPGRSRSHPACATTAHRPCAIRAHQRSCATPRSWWVKPDHPPPPPRSHRHGEGAPNATVASTGVGSMPHLALEPAVLRRVKFLHPALQRGRAGDAMCGGQVRLLPDTPALMPRIAGGGCALAPPPTIAAKCCRQ